MKYVKRGLCLALILALLTALLCGALAEDLENENWEAPPEELPETDLMDMLPPEEEPPVASDALEVEDALEYEIRLPDGDAVPEPDATETETLPPPETAAEPTAEPSPEPAPDMERQVMAVPEAQQAAAPEGIVLAADSITLGLGESYVLQPSVAPAGDGAPVTFSYSTSKKKVATVSAGGVVKAKKKGAAVITVTASNGLQATCAVKVVKAPASIKLNAKSAVLGYDAQSGAAMRYQLTAKLSKGSASKITYYGYNSAVVSVSEDGVITAKGVGSTKIKARTFNKKKATFKVTVKSAPTGIALDAASLTLCEREVRTLKPVLPQNTAASVRFESDNPAVAQVDAATGAITARAVGQATITATAFNGVSAACALSVTLGPDAVSLSHASNTLGVKDSFTLAAIPVRNDGAPTTATVAYKTSNKKIATVSAAGVVKAKKKGKVKITATAPNGVAAVCTVKVVKAPGSIKLNAKKLSMQYDAASGIGALFQLTPKLTKGSVSKITYYGYNPAVVTVSDGGLITAVGVGVTTVTARTYNNKKAKCKITVRAYTGAETSYRRQNPLTVIAHRGGAGYWPENTLTAFANARGKGADGVELDVFTTKDGAQVVHHDQTFTAGGKKYDVTKCTLQQLRSVKPSICTLDEALEVVAANGLQLSLELKANADGAACVQAVRRWGLQDATIYVSFYRTRLEAVRKADGSARLGLLFSKLPKDLAAYAASMKLTSVNPYMSLVTQARLDSWHKAGLLVGTWTANDPMDIKALRDMGVDSICTDYPDYADAVR